MAKHPETNEIAQENHRAAQSNARAADFEAWFINQAQTQEDAPSLREGWQARQQEIDALKAKLDRAERSLTFAGFQAL